MPFGNSTVDNWIEKARTDPENFWVEAANELHWFSKWDRVFDWSGPSFQWFSGAQTNLSYNCLDYHLEKGRGEKTALIYANERGQREKFSYKELHQRVEKISASLRGINLHKGDCVTIYMPLCPEAIMLMLACVRIGVIHSVVFAGFGAGALADRIKASNSKVVFTADITFRKGTIVPLKEIVDSALKKFSDTVESVVILERDSSSSERLKGRDINWETFLEYSVNHKGSHVQMEANEVAYILATSGTTAKPKLAVHTHGGYQVGIHSMGRWCFGLNENDIWWATSDIGWVVGHSYIVYAPLLCGCTSVAYEGALDYPGPEVLWSLIQEFRITGVFTSPTVVRLLMRYGEKPIRGFDFSSLQRLFCAGEALNAPVWKWLQEEVFENRIPVIDHWWQTETGGPVIGNPYGLSQLPIKPGSAGIPLPGMEAAVMTSDGKECPPNEKGILVLKRPFPSLTPTLWNEPERYTQEYWDKISGVYFTGDSAHIDEDGYVWFAGRADEVIKIAAHRIGTVEVETAFLQHPQVSEAGVTGRPDPLRGEVISAFIVLRHGYIPSPQLKKELINTVRQQLGPIAVIGEINFVNTLPKTRSGKIMRRVFKAIILDRDPGDITTIENEGSVEEARQVWKQLKMEIHQDTTSDKENS